MGSHGRRGKPGSTCGCSGTREYDLEPTGPANTATPLPRDIFKFLGRSKCEVLSCVDLKDAFHSLGLTDKAKEFCGILPYFSNAHYRYEVLPMGLSISPQVWITYIENLLEGFPIDSPILLLWMI